MIANTIKALREQSGLSQAQLGRRFNITRSSVCVWEQGLPCPTAQYIIELAGLFLVSTDYILELSTEQTLDLSGLNEEEKRIVQSLMQYFERKMEFDPNSPVARRKAQNNRGPRFFSVVRGCF